MKKMFKKLTAGVCAAAMTLAALNISPAVMQVEAQETASTFTNMYENTYYSFASNEDIKAKVSTYFAESGMKVGVNSPADSAATPDGYEFLFDASLDNAIVYGKGKPQAGDYMQLDFEKPITLSAIKFSVCTQNDSDSQYGFSKAKIQYQEKDSTEWKDLTTSTNTTAVGKEGYHKFEAAEGSELHDVAAVRLTSTYTKTSGSGWSSFYEIDIDAELEPTTKFTSLSASLEGNVELNFKAKIDPAEKDRAVVKFTVDGVEDDWYQPALGNEGAEDGVYVFTREVCAAEMTKKFKATVYSDINSIEELAESEEYSVQDYAKAMYTKLQDPTDTTENKENLQALLKAMLNYGACAQTYWKVDTESMANAVDFMDNVEKTKFTGVTLAEIQAVAGTAVNGSFTDGTESPVTSASLLLQAGTTLRYNLNKDVLGNVWAGRSDCEHYKFNLEDNEESETCIDQNDDGRCFVDARDIPAAELHKQQVLTVTRNSDNESITVSSSALNYAANVVETYGSDDSKADFVNLMKALYQYNRAAVAYFGDSTVTE